jgi:hypothetical protein
MGFLTSSINKLNVILKHNPFAKWQESKVTLIYVYTSNSQNALNEHLYHLMTKAPPFLQIFLWKILNYGFTWVGLFFFVLFFNFLCDSKSDDGLQEDLAKSGYKK